MAKGDPVYGAHNDNVNQVYSMIGVIGTLGTADTAGTANTLPVGVNPDNGALYVDVMDTTFNVGTLTVGTINKVGTVSEVTNGSIKVTSGTGIITSGSIAVVAGTGVVTSGSIAVVAGTEIITSGSIAVTDGTVKVTTNGTIASGSIAVTAGTIGAGTINAGTINSGTINAGTIRIDPRPSQNMKSFATSVSVAGSAYATIIGSADVGVGTSIWVNDVSLLNEAGTVVCAVGMGTWNSGTATLFRGKLGPREGIQKSFPKAVNCGMTNQDLTIWTDGTTTVDVAVSYYISV